jgi:hypothetical protein
MRKARSACYNDYFDDLSSTTILTALHDKVVTTQKAETDAQGGYDLDTSNAEKKAGMRRQRRP